MVAGRKYEMLVKCPACDRRIRIRSGLSGKVQCPLPGCRAIYERHTTSAAVSVVGLASNLDHLLRGQVGAELNEADSSTHAILPLPGGRLAVVRRDRQREQEEATRGVPEEEEDDEAMAEGGNRSATRSKTSTRERSVATAFLHASKAGKWREGVGVGGREGKAELSLRTSTAGPAAQGLSHAVAGGGVAAGFEEEMRGMGGDRKETRSAGGKRWVEEAAAELWQDGEREVVWDAESRSKLLRSHSLPQTEAGKTSEAQGRKSGGSEMGAKSKQESTSSAKDKDRSSFSFPASGSAREVGGQEVNEARMKEEGPEVARESGNEMENEGDGEAAMPLHLVPGNTTGDAQLDQFLKTEGVRFTGDDRPFGMPSMPSKPSTPSTPSGTEKEWPSMPTIPVRGQQQQQQQQQRGAALDLKAAASAEEDARKFEEFYQEYTSRKESEQDPELVEKMRGFREMLSKRAEMDAEWQQQQQKDAAERAQLHRTAKVWSEAMDMLEERKRETMREGETQTGASRTQGKAVGTVEGGGGAMAAEKEGDGIGRALRKDLSALVKQAQGSDKNLDFSFSLESSEHESGGGEQGESEKESAKEGAGEAAGGGQESRGVRRKKLAPWMGKHGHDGGEGCYKPDDEALQKLLLQSAITQLQETEKVRCLWCGVRGSRRRARKHTCHLVWELRDGWDKWRRRMLLVEGNH